MRKKSEDDVRTMQRRKQIWTRSRRRRERERERERERLEENEK